MANPDAPFGFCPVTSTTSEYIGQTNEYYIPDTNATPLAVGDFVISGGSADPDGVPSVARAAAGDVVRGVITGFRYDRTYEDLPNYRPAGVEAYAEVMDDPMGRIIAQEDSDTATLAATDVGQNVNFIVANPNTTTGKSQMEINSDTAAPTNTLPLKINELWQRDDNEIGDNAIWVLTFNTHELKTDTGSTGV